MRKTPCFRRAHPSRFRLVRDAAGRGCRPVTRPTWHGSITRRRVRAATRHPKQDRLERSSSRSPLNARDEPPRGGAVGSIALLCVPSLSFLRVLPQGFVKGPHIYLVSLGCVATELYVWPPQIRFFRRIRGWNLGKPAPQVSPDPFLGLLSPHGWGSGRGPESDRHNQFARFPSRNRETHGLEPLSVARNCEKLPTNSAEEAKIKGVLVRNLQRDRPQRSEVQDRVWLSVG